MDSLYGKYLNNQYLLKLQGGILCKDFYIYSKNEELLIIKDDIRMFKVSFKRLKKTFRLDLENIFLIIIKNINNICLDFISNNSIKYFLVVKKPDEYLKSIYEYKIKLKEIDEYLDLSKSIDPNVIISKQNKKINLLLKKIESYKKKYYEPTTDEEFL
jgi:hypothetical protein